MTRRFVALVLAAFLALPAAALAVSLTEVAQELRCVTCGTSLDVSDARSAQEMKARIQRRIDEGATKQQIIDEFVHDYGRQVLATPPKRGFDLVVGWLIPIGAVLVAVLAMPLLIRTWNRRRRTAQDGPGSDPADDLTDVDRARLDRELDAFDG